jgi:hypothetical protein
MCCDDNFKANNSYQNHIKSKDFMMVSDGKLMKIKN